jgi:hypothetical protein
MLGMVRLLSKLARRIGEEWVIDHVTEVAAGVGFGAVVGVLLMALLSGLRELTVWLQVVFLAGWLSLGWLVVWLAMPSLVRLRASSRAEAFAIADTLRNGILGDEKFRYMQVVEIEVKWTISDVQNLLRIVLHVANPTPFLVEFPREFSGLIRYRGAELAPPTIEWGWTTVHDSRSFSPSRTRR